MDSDFLLECEKLFLEYNPKIYKWDELLRYCIYKCDYTQKNKQIHQIKLGYVIENNEPQCFILYTIIFGKGYKSKFQFIPINQRGINYVKEFIADYHKTYEGEMDLTIINDENPEHLSVNKYVRDLFNYILISYHKHAHFGRLLI
jgi:hypothetical protein